MRLAELFSLARDSVRDPAQGWRQMRRLELDRGTLMTALFAIVAVSVVLAEIAARLLLLETGAAHSASFYSQPLGTAAVQLGLLLTLTLSLFVIGRSAGGKGSFDDCLLAVVWLQFIMACLQAAQALAILVLPTVATLIGLAGIILFFWLLTGFVTELHGFQSRGRVLAALIAGVIALSALLVVVLGILGIGLPQMGEI